MDRMSLPNLHQLAGLAKGQRLNQDRIDDAEQGRIGSHSQRDSKNCGETEDGSALKKAADRGSHASRIRRPLARDVRLLSIAGKNAP